MELYFLWLCTSTGPPILRSAWSRSNSRQWLVSCDHFWKRCTGNSSCYLVLSTWKLDTRLLKSIQKNFVAAWNFLCNYNYALWTLNFLSWLARLIKWHKQEDLRKKRKAWIFDVFKLFMGWHIGSICDNHRAKDWNISRFTATTD